MKTFKVYYSTKLKQGYLSTTVEANNKKDAISIASKKTLINSKFLTCNIEDVQIKIHYTPPNIHLY